MEKTIIDILSDTHNQHEKFECEGGEILVHAGDATLRGTEVEIFTFLDWYSLQDYSHLVFVPGNHDFGFERIPALFAEACADRNIILLNDSGVCLEGINFWGSPVQPWFHNWAYNRERGPDIKHHWDMIPQDTEFLITHGPAYGFGDVTTYVDGTPKERVGCQDLADKILQTQIKLHAFGHIHEDRGVIALGPTTFVNASALDRMYCPVTKKPIRAIREVLQDESILYSIHEY
jgi:Icc-related predicted phosphoesterase